MHSEFAQHIKSFCCANCFHFTFDDHVSFSAVEKSDSLVNMTTHSIEISRTFMYTWNFNVRALPFCQLSFFVQHLEYESRRLCAAGSANLSISLYRLRYVWHVVSKNIEKSHFFHKPQHDNRGTAINTDILLCNAVDLDQNISGDNVTK